MTSLGDLGTPRGPVDPDTFGWFGSVVRVNPAMTDLDLADFLEVAGSLDIDDAAQALAAMGALKGFLRSLIHPDDFAAFWATAKANGQQFADLMTIGRRIIEGVTDRPTMRPSGSTDGPSSTPTSSRSDAASIAASAHPGRPDLQVAALRAVG